MSNNNHDELANQFHSDMLNIYKEAKKINYTPTAFLQMLTKQNGLIVAKKLINSNQPSTGFSVLWDKKRLDLTVEALVLKVEYSTLFSKEERQTAKERLMQYGYKNVRMNEDEELITAGKIKLPKLVFSSRAREYNFYSEEKKDSIVYEYLFNSMSHRGLDENVLMIPVEVRTGHESMNILHFIGLRDIHKGIFKDYSIEQAIKRLEHQEQDFSIVTQSLYRLNKEINGTLNDILNSDIDSEKAEDDSYYKDGAVNFYYGKRYERNPENRKKAIEIHGLNCFACGFNFEEIYGERGKGFIEVHHVSLLSTLVEETIINPEKDLVPVCSNCHRMIHRKKDNVLTIDELKEILNNKRNKLPSF
ncbi:hypothetical protein HMPREF1210_00153 [Paenisporosarcina sp. HGH0030]|uniref:HNH endonuclease n=1 Tax=Paenisporosarcina sp. HGH0030 TaxID=1078085 RepID=UPI00034E7680|nr:HNH endonuclease [Paenisporosarcina sp. HGH0030]EPD54168.1 hypothetical protein HMPREF1210_00153 [Paenisporosarcina sp. HGH0030]